MHSGCIAPPIMQGANALVKVFFPIFPRLSPFERADRA